MKKKPELGISEAFISRDRKERILNPYADADRDGVLNFMDCKPFDRKKHGTYTRSGGGHSFTGGSSGFSGRGGYTPSPRGGYTYTPGRGTITRGAILAGAQARRGGYPTVYGTLVGTPMGEATYRATRGMSASMRGATIGAIEKSYRSPMSLTTRERALIKPHLSEFAPEFQRKFHQAEMKVKLREEKEKIRPKEIKRVRPSVPVLPVPGVPGLTTGLLYGITPETKELARRVVPGIVPTAVSLAKKGIALSPAFLPIIPAVTIVKKVVPMVPHREIVRRYEAFIAPAVGVVKHKMDIARAYSEVTTPEGLITAFEKTEGRKLTRAEREKVTRAFEKGEEVSGEYRRGFGLPSEEMKWEREGAKFQSKVLAGRFRPAEEQFTKQIIEPVSVKIGGERARVIQKQERVVQTNIKDMDRISVRHPEWRKPSGEIILPTTLKPEVLRIEKNIEHLQVEAKNKGWVTSTGDLRYPDTAAGRSWARSYTDAIEKQKKYITPDGYYKSDYIKYTPEAQKYHDTYQKYETSQTKLESMPLPTSTKQFARGIGEAFVSIPIAPLFIGRVAAETIVAPTTAPLRAKRFGEEYAEFARKEPFRVSGQVAGMLIPAARRAPIVPKIIRGVKVTEAGKIAYIGLGIRGIKEPKPVLGFYKEIARTPEGIGVQRAVVLGKKYPAAMYIKSVREAEVPVPEFGEYAKGFGRETYREIRLGREGPRFERMRWEGLAAKDYLLPERAVIMPETPSRVGQLFLPFEKPVKWKRTGPTEIAERVTTLKKTKQPKPDWGIRIEKPKVPTIIELAPKRAYKVVKGYDAFQIGAKPKFTKILRRKWNPEDLPKVAEKVIHRIRKEIIERKVKVLEYKRPKGLLGEGLILDIKSAKIRKGERPLSKIEELYEKVTADDIYREIETGKITKKTVRVAEDAVARERPDWLEVKEVAPVKVTDYDKITKSLLKGKKMSDLSLSEYTEFLKNSMKKTNIIKVVDGYGIYATEWKGNIVYGAIDMKSGFGSISGRRSLKKIIVDIKEGVPAQLIRDDPIGNSVKGQYEYMKRIAAAEEKYGGKAKRFRGRKGDKVLDIGAGIQPDLRATHAIDLVKADKKFKSLEYKHGYDFSKETTKLPYRDNTFDVIVSYGALGRNFETQMIYNEIRRVLKPGGRLEFNADSPKTEMFLERAGFEKPYMEKYFDKSLNKEIGVIVVKKALFPEKFISKPEIALVPKKARRMVTKERVEQKKAFFFPDEYTLQPEVAVVVPKKARRMVTKERVEHKFEYVVDDEPSLVSKVSVKRAKSRMREPEAVVGRVRKTKPVTGIPIFDPRVKRREKLRHERMEAPFFSPAEAFFKKEEPKKEPYGMPIFEPAEAPLPEPKPAEIPLPREYPRPYPRPVPEHVPKPVPELEPIPEPKLFPEPKPAPKPRPEPKPKPPIPPEPEPIPVPEEDKRKKIRKYKRRKEEYFKFGEVTGVLLPEEMRKRTPKKRVKRMPAKIKTKPRKRRSVVESFMLPM